MDERALALLEKLRGSAGAKGKAKSRELLHDFKEGYATGWCFEVPVEFRPALSITKEERRDGATTRFVTLQGALFDFKRGDVVYDTRRAYEDRAHAKVRVQVRAGAPAIPAEKEAPRHEGSVTFEVYVQNGDATRFVSRGVRTATQDEFVRFLVAGPPPSWSDVAEVFKGLGLPTAHEPPRRDVDEDKRGSQGTLL